MQLQQNIPRGGKYIGPIMRDNQNSIFWVKYRQKCRFKKKEEFFFYIFIFLMITC